MARAGTWAAIFAATMLSCVATACDSGTPGDTQDGGSGDGGDAGGEGGLVFRWKSKPAPDAELDDHVTLREVHLRLRDVRAIGDAAPGDLRTWVPSLQVRWVEGSSPGALVFPLAPPGLYSRFELKVQSSGDGHSLELRGDVLREGEVLPRPFEIEDDSALPISLPLSGLELSAGQTIEVEIAIDVAAVLQKIDWDEVPVDALGRLHIDDDSSQMADVREAIAKSFSTNVVVP